MEKQSIIKVSGTAKLLVAPDYNSIKIEVERNFPTNAEAYEAAKQNSLAVIAALEGVGLDGSLAKTTKFNICEHIDSTYKDDGFGSRVVSRRKNGYDINQSFCIELPASNEQINEICVAITEGVPAAEIKLDSFLSNRREHQRKALALAALRAREKAEIMATTLGCTLGNIIEMEGDESRFTVYDGDCDDLPLINDSSPLRSNLAMTGEDQTISASVKVIWQLVNP